MISNAEAEYVILCESVKVVVCLQRELEKFGFHQNSTAVAQDNSD